MFEQHRVHGYEINVNNMRLAGDYIEFVFIFCFLFMSGMRPTAVVSDGFQFNIYDPGKHKRNQNRPLYRQNYGTHRSDPNLKTSELLTVTYYNGPVCMSKFYLPFPQTPCEPDPVLLIKIGH